MRTMTTHPGQTSQRQRHQRWPWIVGAAVAVLGFGSYAMGADDSSSGTGDEYAARNVCKQFVEDRLVSPSSADFTDTSARHLQGSSEWLVTGSVDAENRMGASIRVDYQCQVAHEGGDNYRLVDLQHSER